MAFEQRDMSGVLFKNEEKKTEKHPDYQGEAMIGGKKLRLSAWIKTGKKGKFMSLAFSAAQEFGGKSKDDGEVPF